MMGAPEVRARDLLEDGAGELFFAARLEAGEEFLETMVAEIGELAAPIDADALGIELVAGDARIAVDGASARRTRLWIVSGVAMEFVVVTAVSPDGLRVDVQRGNAPVAHAAGSKVYLDLRRVAVWPVVARDEELGLSVVVSRILGDWHTGARLLQRRATRVRLEARGADWDEAGRLLGLCIRVLCDSETAPAAIGSPLPVHVVAIAEGADGFDDQVGAEGVYRRFADLDLRG